MGKNTENTEATETTENSEAAAAEPKVDKRSKMITTPAGEEVKRTDYIRSLWASKTMTRGEIRDHLKNECTAANGENDIAYQIVFAATKNLEGGPSEADLQARKDAKAAEKASKAEDAEGAETAGDESAE